MIMHVMLGQLCYGTSCRNRRGGEWKMYHLFLKYYYYKAHFIWKSIQCGLADHSRHLLCQKLDLVWVKQVELARQNLYALWPFYFFSSDASSPFCSNIHLSCITPLVFKLLYPILLCNSYYPVLIHIHPMLLMSFGSVNFSSFILVQSRIKILLLVTRGQCF